MFYDPDQTDLEQIYAAITADEVEDEEFTESFVDEDEDEDSEEYGDDELADSDSDSDEVPEPVVDKATKPKSKSKFPVKKAELTPSKSIASTARKTKLDAGPAEGRLTEYLLPSEIAIDKRFDVRPYATLNGDTASEQEKIQELAESLEKDGQINPILVTRDPEKTSKARPIVIAGHRRFKAAGLINEARSAKGKGLFRLRVEYVPFEKALQTAVIDNMQRQQMSVLDVAMVAKRLREENGWKEGNPGAIKVAQFMRVSKATILQADKMLTQGDELTCNAVHEGKISAESAFNLLKLTKSEREQVLTRAEEIQSQKNPPLQTLANQRKSKSGIQVPEKSFDAASNALGGKNGMSSKAGKAPKAGKLESPAINEAIREVAPEKAPKRTRKEILEFFKDQDAPVNGYKNGATRQFLKFFIEKWAEGTGTDKTLTVKFDEMVKEAYKGTETKADLAE